MKKNANELLVEVIDVPREGLPHKETLAICLRDSVIEAVRSVQMGDEVVGFNHERPLTTILKGVQACSGQTKISIRESAVDYLVGEGKKCGWVTAEEISAATARGALEVIADEVSSEPKRGLSRWLRRR